MYGATRGCGGKGLLWSLVQVALQFFVSACGCVNWSFASCCFDESNSGVCDCLEFRLTTSQRSVWSPFPTWTWRNCEDHLVFTRRVPDTHVSRIACRTHRSNPIRQAGWNSLPPWPGSFWMADLTFTLQSVKHQLFFVKLFLIPWYLISYADFIWYLELKIMILWYWQHLGEEQIAQGQPPGIFPRSDRWLHGQLCHLSGFALGRLSIYAQRGTERKFSSASECRVTQIDATTMLGLVYTLLWNMLC